MTPFISSPEHEQHSSSVSAVEGSQEQLTERGERAEAGGVPSPGEDVETVVRRITSEARELYSKWKEPFR